MSKCIFSPLAKQDLKEINKYIIRFNLAAAKRFKDKIKQQCKMLVDYPYMGQSYNYFQGNLRSFPVEDYLIFYRSIDGGVEIVRVHIV
jgi:toxin ParE1/3/4